MADEKTTVVREGGGGGATVVALIVGVVAILAILYLVLNSGVLQQGTPKKVDVSIDAKQ